MSFLSPPAILPLRLLVMLATARDRPRQNGPQEGPYAVRRWCTTRQPIGEYRAHHASEILFNGLHYFAGTG